MTRRTALHVAALIGLMVTIAGALELRHSSAEEAGEASFPGAEAGVRRETERDGPRLREGTTLVDQLGELREAGGGVVFYPDGSAQSLQLLENLALERVSHDLDQPHRKWSVSGTVTEYRGANYLLLQRAVLKTRVSTGP